MPYPTQLMQEAGFQHGISYETRTLINAFYFCFVTVKDKILPSLYLSQNRDLYHIFVFF